MYKDYDFSVVQCLSVHVCTYNFAYNDYLLPTISLQFMNGERVL